MNENPEVLYYTDENLTIEFVGFIIRNPDTGKVYFNRSSIIPDVGETELLPDIPPANGICYLLPEDFLRASAIACQIIFRNRSNQPIVDMKIIEEHILQGTLLQSYEFEMPFVAPNTQNTWENMYVPEFKRGQSFEERARDGPWTVVTSLYIDGKLMLRNRAQLKFK